MRIFLKISPIDFTNQPHFHSPDWCGIWAIQNKETHIHQLCKELNIGRTTLYRYVDPNGQLRSNGKKVVNVVGGIESAL